MLIDKKFPATSGRDIKKEGAMSDKAKIGKQIKDIRKALGLTQQGFADRFNATCPSNLATTRADIARYETGKNSVPAEKYVFFLSLADVNESSQPMAL